ncbi:MAG: DUF2878 family protein [Pseudomonadota bacterium]
MAMPTFLLRAHASPWLPLALFKLQWLLLVPGGSRFLLLAALLLALQTLLLWRRRGIDGLWPALVFALVGMAMDQALSLLGVLHFDTRLLPASLLLLWLAFALTLPLLPVLEQMRWGALAVGGALLGIAGYGAAFLLGALDFGLVPAVSLLVIAASWALLLPLRHWLFCRSLLRHRLPTVLLTLLALCHSLPLRAQAAETWPVIGNATFRVLWHDIYDATLQSPVADFGFPGQPFSLTLRYYRSIRASRIVDTTLDQWSRQQLRAPPAWRNSLAAAIPEVMAGDVLRLEVPAAGPAMLVHNDKVIASFDDEAFVTALAGIWLGEGTSNPVFRKQLLGDNK